MRTAIFLGALAIAASHNEESVTENIGFYFVMFVWFFLMDMSDFFNF